MIIPNVVRSCPDQPAHCNWNEFSNPGPNYQMLYGALVGGPNQYDNYTDVRSDYVANEVSCDYNAGFQGAVAGGFFHFETFRFIHKADRQALDGTGS